MSSEPFRQDYIASTSNKFFPRKYGTVEDRFWSKVLPEPNSGCWLWCGDSNGNYGNFGIVDKTTKRQRRILAHRFSYELHYGKIPKDKVIDHKCRMKLCVNPDHLRAVTPKENTHYIPAGIRGNNQIKTHCKKGHPLSGDNLTFDNRGHARCLLCQRTYFREYYRGNNPRGIKRRAIPPSIKIVVARRQLGNKHLKVPTNMTAKQQLTALLQLLNIKDPNFDHYPAIMLRPLNNDSTDTVPPMNDPDFIVIRSAEEHRIKTYVRGDGAQLSDAALARKNKRIERNRDPKRKRPKIAQRKNFKWPKRQIRSRVNVPSV